ncbi:CHASE2 domain-containing protein [Desulfovibrio inopinatus]|uniref:CHASE2 domain-containing protein n=1 Tax=Desulfovibrio inopinatus TaxID=102109 RepID=UPI00041C94B6|nr:CHASE2 domain-containing protein [Desulfovibrio inopinatus]
MLDSIWQKKRSFGLLSNLAVIVTGAVVSALLAFLAWRNLPPVITMDNAVHDAFIRLGGAQHPSMDQAIMADIDEESIVSIGQWPWPRYRIAAVMNTLAEAKSTAIGLDIIFPEPDQTSLLTIQKAFQKEFDLNLQFQGVPPGLDDNDAYLSYVFNRTGAVGAIFMYFDLYNAVVECTPTPLHVTGETDLISPPEASGVLCNTPKIQAGLTRYGFINTRLDSDGMLRKMQLLIAYNGAWYPNLTLATLMQALGQNSISIDSDMFGPLLVIGETRIPVDATGMAVIAFPNREHCPQRLSVVRILTGEIPPETLQGKIVFLGCSAAGLNDLHHTPVSPELPGALTHAILTENALSGKTYRTPVWKTTYTGLTTLVTGLLVTFLFVSVGPGWAATGALLLCLLFPVLSVFFFFAQGVLLPMSGQFGTTFVLLLILSLLLYARERRLAYIRLKQFSRARQTTLEAMAAVAETRDPETGGHIKRTQHYVKALATELAKRGNRPELTNEFIDLLFHSAPLHDVGKVGVPDHILLKPGKLTFEEFEEMKKHTVFGKEIVENASRGQDEKEFFDLSGEIAYTHHEKWDGSGYPLGLAEENIPLSGRLMALADVYDALISKRHYKPPFSHEKSKAIILEGDGKHFDPEVVETFLTIEQEFIRIAATFKDEESKEDTPQTTV